MSRLNIVISYIFSGKKSYLIKEINKIQNNESLLSINHKIDDRYDNNKIINHNKQSIDCLSLSNIKDIYKYDIELHNLEYIFIDEAQFFNDLEETVKYLLDTYPKLKITCVGLDGDYKQNMFNNGQLLHLILLSDNVIKLYSKCYQCGEKAGFTKRLHISDNEQQQIVVGSSDIYQPSCYIHK